jgi:hypothetical protein
LFNALVEAATWANVGDMPRARRDPNAAPMTRTQAAAVATSAREGRSVPLAERRARYALVEALLVGDTSAPNIAAACAERFAMSASAVERVKSRVLRDWASHDLALRDLRRAQARRRLLAEIKEAVSSKKLRVAVQLEALLLKVDGLLTPQELTATAGAGRQGEGMLALVGSMSQAEIDAAVAEQLEVEAKVRAYDRLCLPGPRGRA